MDGLFFPLMLALLAGFVFLSFRNNKKRQQAQQDLQAKAVPGAYIQLSSGLFGTVVSDDGGESVEVEIAPGVVTRWNRLAIRDVIPEVSDAEKVAASEEDDEDAFASIPDYTEEDAAADAAAEAASADAPEASDTDAESKDK